MRSLVDTVSQYGHFSIGSVSQSNVESDPSLSANQFEKKVDLPSDVVCVSIGMVFCAVLD